MKFWEYMVNFFNKVECNKNLKFILESWGDNKKKHLQDTQYTIFLLLLLR